MKKTIIALLFLINFVSVSMAKDSLVLGMRLEPPHLDPTANSAAAIDEVVYGNVFEGLFQITSDGGYKKLLAKNYKVSTDGTTYNIVLKNNVYFHNGDKLTADDVVFSLNRIYAEGSTNPRKSLFANIKSVNKKNDYEVVIKLKSATADLLYNLALPDAVIFNKDNYKNNKNHPIGTGAFKFVKMKKGYFAQLTRNDKYHGKAPKLKSVKFRFIADGLTASTAMLSGEVDGFPFYNDVMTLNAFDGSDFKIVSGSTEGEVLIALNNRHKHLKNKKVRQALTYAMDKKAIAKILSPGAKTIGSHYPPHGQYYVNLANAYPYNPEKAKKMLKENGAQNMKLEFTVPPSYKLHGDVIAGYLRGIGIKVKMKQVDWGTWLSGAFKKYQYDITVITHVEPKDYGIYANPKYYFGYDNKDYQKLVADLKTETDKNKRKQSLQKIQKKLSDDAVNVWLYQLPKTGVWHKNIRGFWKDSPVEGNILNDVYWAE